MKTTITLHNAVFAKVFHKETVAMTTATMGKAKLLGLDKQMVEVKAEVSSFEDWVKEVSRKEQQNNQQD